MKISKERIAHCHGVAEYMYEHAPDYELEPDYAYVLGLLHDVGYIFGKELHEQEGARLLEELGYKDAAVVRFHGKEPSYLKKILLVDELPDDVVLLMEADMHVDLTGEDVGYEKRLEDIKERHGAESKAYKVCLAQVEYLRSKGR